MENTSINFIHVIERENVAPKKLPENVIWLGTGSRNEGRVFNREKKHKSVLDTIFNAADERVFEELVDYRDRHVNPSFEFHISGLLEIDLIASLYVIEKIIETGKTNPHELFSAAVIDKLLYYTNSIAVGKRKNITKRTLYAYFCKIGIDEEDFEKRAHQIIDAGLKLVDLIFEALEKHCDIDLFDDELCQYLDGKENELEEFEKLQERIDEQTLCYENDKKRGVVLTDSVDLWNDKKQIIEPVEAAIWKKRPGTEDIYLNARAQGALLTVFPYSLKGKRNPKTKKEDLVTDVMISINPDLPEAEEYSLLPMVEVLEQCEQIEEDRLYKQTGRYRRDHSQSKDSDGTFTKIPFSETSDPWSINDNNDFVKSPNIGSILSYETILTIINNSMRSHGNSKNPDSSYITQVSKTVFSDMEDEVIKSDPVSNTYSFGQLYEDCRKEIKELGENSYLFYFVKVNPAILKYNNDFLKSCCLKMVGKSDVYSSIKNLMFIDYRTCLYCDDSIAIVTMSEPNVDNSKTALVEGVERTLLDHLETLLKQRSAFRVIARSLPDILDESSLQPEKVEQLNVKLVRLNSDIEKEDIILDSVEQEIYTFMRESLGIHSLKDSVTNSTELLIENVNQQREKEAKKLREEREEREKEENEKEIKRDSKLQVILALVAVLGIISALADLFGSIDAFTSDGVWNELTNKGRTVAVVGMIVISIIAVSAIIFLAMAIVRSFWTGKNNKGEDKK